jgi:hypothetical protein
MYKIGGRGNVYDIKILEIKVRKNTVKNLHRKTKQ